MARREKNIALPSVGWQRLRPRAMTDIIDIHSHTPRPGAIYNANLTDCVDNHILFSIGIHPWDSAEVTKEQWERLIDMAQKPNCVAIGEAGLDSLRGPDIARQLEVFERQIRLSMELDKPLIVHCVKQYDNLVPLFKKYNPGQPWIVHGFRGKPQQALQLIDTGLYLSFGEKFNPDTVAAMPADKILIETDQSPLDIHTIARNIGVAPQDISQNVHHLTSLRFK